jgi:capsular polysaccharide export protein
MVKSMYVRRKLVKIVKLVLTIFTVCFWAIRPIKHTKKPVAFLFHVSKWKYSFIPFFLKEYEIRFVPFDHQIKFLRYELSKYPNKVFIIWGYNHSNDVIQYAKKHNIPIYRMEDGFVRSKGLGALHTPPYSISLDKQGMYFDSTQPSDLEDLLNTHQFSEEELSRARDCINKLNQLGVSKYNHVNKKDVSEIYGKKTKKRILVIGQVEDDASIKMGCATKFLNNDLVCLASKENPDAEIIYKPHPDVLTGRRLKHSDPDEVKHLAKVITEPLSLVDSLKTIDHVYTITSLSGFEALMRGIKVTTIGAPFYSGWGLTDDRQMVTRRKRKLTVEEVFAGAYLLYPRYVDPSNGENVTLEDVIERIAN